MVNTDLTEIFFFKCKRSEENRADWKDAVRERAREILLPRSIRYRQETGVLSMTIPKWFNDGKYR